MLVLYGERRARGAARPANERARSAALYRLTGVKAFAASAWCGLVFLCARSEEHTSELQSLMRISYAVFCLKKKTNSQKEHSQQKNQTQDADQRQIRKER